jgi:hypothetical protein
MLRWSGVAGLVLGAPAIVLAVVERYASTGLSGAAIMLGGTSLLVTARARARRERGRTGGLPG